MLAEKQNTPLAPLGRRELKKRETRLRILDSAMRLMAVDGYDGVTVGEICKEADIANATFFGYFPTKAGLIEAFNEQMSARIKDKLSAFDIPAPEKIELLRVLIIDEWRAQASVLNGLMGSIASGKSQSVPLLSANKSLIDLTSGVIREGQTTGEFIRHIQAETISLTLVSAWTSITLQLAAGADLEERLLAHRHVLDMVLRGIQDKEN